MFLCYKETGEDGQRTRDSLMAQEVYYELTEQGYRVFFARITLEDKAGTEYEPYIFAALNSAKVMVVIGTTPEHFNAVWVKNEWSRFLSMMKKDRSKLLLPCYRDMDPYDLPEALSVLQSYDMSKIGFMQDLIRGVKKVIDAGKPQEAAKETVKETVVVHNEGGSNVQALLKRGNMALEDGEWTKADEFFEQVLNQDAECSAAYLGKFLARVKCRSAKAYTDAFIGNVKANVPSKKNAYACEEDTVFVSSCMEKYTVPGILSENEIRQMLKFDLGYCKTSDYYAEIAEKARMQLAADKDLMRAAKYASSEAKTITENIPQTLDMLRRDAQQREKVECAAITENYRDFLTKTEAKLEKEHPQRLKEAQEQKKAAAKTRKITTIVLSAAAAIIAVVLLITKVIVPAVKYSMAKKLLADGDYDSAIAAFAALGDYRNAAQDCPYIEAEQLQEQGKTAEAAIAFGRIAGYKDAQERSLALWNDVAQRDSIGAGDFHTIGLKTDGTVCAVGRNTDGQCDVSDWTDIIAVSAGYDASAGLKADGTVVTTEKTLNSSDWEDIVSISLGNDHMVGLRMDGTVVAVGKNIHGQCNVSGWKDIIAISAGRWFTVGLKANGTVVATGINIDGQCDVSKWSEITAIAAGMNHTVGLKKDGTVVAVGSDEDKKCFFAKYMVDTVAIAAGANHTVAMSADGTVMSRGWEETGQNDVSDWTDIVAIAAGNGKNYGIKSDGTVVFAGRSMSGEGNVFDWTNIKLPN